MMYMVTAIRDTYEANGVEVAGIFDTEEKAYEAKAKVVEWMEENGSASQGQYSPPPGQSDPPWRREAAMGP